MVFVPFQGEKYRCRRTFFHRGNFNSLTKSDKTDIAENCKGAFDPALPEGFAVTGTAVRLAAPQFYVKAL